MARFIGIRSIVGPTPDLTQNETYQPLVRVLRKSPSFWDRGASFLVLAVVLGMALPICAQRTGTDASATSGLASTANLIRWTGSLPKAAGRTVDISFALYQYPAGGDWLWSETQTVTVAADGRYTVLLGSSSAEGLPQALFETGEARWIEARPLDAQFIAAPNGDEIAEVAGAPHARSLLAAVPYAFKSADAEALAGHSADDYVTREELSSTIADKVQAISSASGSTASIGAQTGTGTSGYLPVWTAPSTLGNSMVAESGTGVGLGTTAPATMLDVNGASTLRGTVSLLAIAATLAGGVNSPPLQMQASSYSSASGAAMPQNFVWQAESTGNNTTHPAADLALLFGAGAATPAHTGLSIAPDGIITFAPGQTFPATNAGPGTEGTYSNTTSQGITGVTAGAGLTGGGTTGNITLALAAPIAASNGGTGATTASGALANLGIGTYQTGNYAAGSTSGGILEAYAACPTAGCEVQLSSNITISSTQTIVPLFGKPLKLNLAGHSVTCTQQSGACLILASAANYGGQRINIEISGGGGVITYGGSSKNVSGLQIGNSTYIMTNVHVHDLAINNFKTPGSIGLNLYASEEGKFDAMAYSSNNTAIYLGATTNQNEFSSNWVDGNVNSVICSACSGATFVSSTFQSNTGTKTIQILAGSEVYFLNDWFENSGDGTSATRQIYIFASAGEYALHNVFNNNTFNSGVNVTNQGFVFEAAGSGSILGTLIENNIYNSLAGKETGFQAGSGTTVVNDDFSMWDVGMGAAEALHPGLSFCPSPGQYDCYMFQDASGALRLTDITSKTNIADFAAAGATMYVPLSAPGISINGGATITSQSSSGSQVVTCPKGGVGTQYCDAAGSWISAPSGNLAFTSLSTHSIPVANGSNSLMNSSIVDNGSTVSTTENLGVGTAVAYSKLQVNGAIETTAITASNLALCVSTLEGAQRAVTDAAENETGLIVTGGGSYHVNAYCNGTNWIVQATAYNAVKATILPGSNVSAVCATAACTILRGTVTVTGGNATTGTIVSLRWLSTGDAYVCTATQNGGGKLFNIGNSVATATGFDITAGISVKGSTLTVNYSCQP